ncbi:kielin/chordin-like protein [Silurus meridionalis]|uniref:kielin/chordin-like protein n=1 Tax=Silurus meridionalis TaxID=175797 RepID=UPI001EEAD71C|nr:kielin/chordin-like protein [Silurus meridionalis]
MELVMGRRRRRFLSALLSVCALWRICSASSAHHNKQLKLQKDPKVIDILQTLSDTHFSREINKVEGHDPGTPAWHFHCRTPHVTLPLDVSRRFVRAWRGSLGVFLVARQVGGSAATLLSLSAPGNVPLLRLVSNTQEDFLQLEIRTEPSMKPEVLRFPGGNPFSGGKWARVVLGVAPGWVWLFKECKEVTVLRLTHQEQPLTLNRPPHGVRVTLASTADDKASKFYGLMQTAVISTEPYEKRPWLCRNVSDSAPIGPTPYTSVDVKQELQDQPDRSSVLGPPAASRARAIVGEQRRERVKNLEEILHNFTTMLDFLKQQNEDLQVRVKYLESCECVRKTCTWESREMEEGSHWSIDGRTECSCSSGKVQCETSKRCEYDGGVYNDEEVFVPKRNPCLNCTCTDSVVRCQSIRCPTPQCANHFKRPGECCPRCSVCGIEERIHNVSYSTVDGCQTCSCRNGGMSCVDRQNCPQSCENGVKPRFGSCCRDCSRCEYRGEVIPNGVSFPDQADVCKLCVCSNGNVGCSNVPCPTPECGLVETVSGECCPRCRSCIHEGVRHEHGSKWQHPGEPCRVCTCSEGRVDCSTEKCNTECRDPTPSQGTCCPSCERCSRNRQNFLNGEPVPSNNRCERCVCENGNINCQPLPCPALNCPHPIRRNGDCCPKCEQCNYESEVYSDGQNFTSKQNPCLTCQCLAGEVVCENTESLCSSLQCTHPTRQRDTCCPTCNSCEYERRVYADGEVFKPAGNGPCLECVCERNVRCHQERCPKVRCANLVRDPHVCCPVCKDCVLDDVEYEHKAEWDSEDTPCTRCSCTEGKVRCSVKECPLLSCRHPNKETGECCPVCNHCFYNQRVYENGQTFFDPDDTCNSCTCQDGSVRCSVVECPPVSCSNPYTAPGECCPQCPTCGVQKQVYVDGDTFANPANPCEECVCRGGRVDCHQQCPRPNCHYPVTGTCCQNNCNGCSYAGKDYPNGAEFPHPTDSCRECHCLNGNVQCRMSRCPAVHCSEPTIPQGQCCPQCPAPPADCVYEERLYRHTQRFYHPTDSCQLCSCTNGTASCHHKPCPAAPCPHPILQECCRTCDGCLYRGVERANGEQFADVSDPCGRCVCREGRVTCERQPCPQITCPFPVQRECCQSCDGCHYAGVDYISGQEFLDPSDRCKHCTCINGDVTCRQKPCYNPGCTHPAPSPGHCCPVCDACFYEGEIVLDGQTQPDRTDPCSECTCRRGSVQCVSKVCAAVHCSNPVTGSCGCPVCEGCSFRRQVYEDGEVFHAPNSECEECTCTKGEVRCTPKSCPSVSCSHPTVDGCGCAECNSCTFHRRECVNGEHFPHPEDNCQRCTCMNGHVSCLAAPCPTVSCRRPVRPTGSCCPVCTGVCEHMGQEYNSGSSFTPSTDPCLTCTCLNEVVSCQRKSCPQQCTHPARYSECCPVCDTCLYESVQHTHTQTFIAASNPCLRCVCVHGSVTCTQLTCPALTCSNPVTPSGQCCPQCRVCVQNGAEYREGDMFRLLGDQCSQCICQNGEVICAGSQCQKLNCMNQVTDPGSCCPRCRGCVYDGVEHTESSTWFASSGPCMSCMCVDGVTTCSEIQCLSPCINKISVPGECCPLCADCIYEGRVYGPGENFHPSDDPCQICTCEVMSDGQQHLRCYRKQCPRLVDCPKNYIMFTSPDSCCPVCAQPLSICTEAMIGNEVLATDDPCFTCQCKDLTWTCIHKPCPSLSCPPDDQYTPPDSCCPVCDACVVEGGRRHVKNGQSWTDSEDECITCSCKLGHIECNIEECGPLVCEVGLMKVKMLGKCCYECQDVRAQCVYEGQVYDSNEQWDVDECTSCTCVSGDVHCKTERCPPLSCASDETPSVIPGMCCPRCIPRPATCIVFGDPHYRTFDGKMVNFQGTCTYVLAQDCEGGDFSVHVTNDDRGRKGVSWTKEVTVYIRDVVIQLLQDWVVKVDHETVTLPFLKEPYIYLERKSNTILLNTNVGVKVLWNGRSHLEVSVPGTYKQHMCGLCGNFNNYPQDDMRLRNGQISSSEAAFGNSWKVSGGNNASARCEDARNIDPCKEAGYSFRKMANGRCAVLKSAVFERCHRVVPPEMFFASCVYDLCACAANADECLCDALEAYASECREAGVVLQWRSPSLCAVGCPVDRGYVFDECGPPCPKTCLNKDVPLGVIEAHCFKPCVPGCQCPAGLVEHESHCISPEKCPKIIHGNP